MTISIIRGDARNLPLPDESVDLVVTSPPYFALRSYSDGGEHYGGQVGSEATPAEFIEALVDCTREMVRVLKPTGSIWLNLGDKYSTGNSGQSGMAKLGEQYRGGGHSEQRAKRRSGRVEGVQPKSLLLLPERYRIACVDQLGLIARAVVIWSKPNGLPESVSDRVRRSHEDWVHLTKQPRYFAAVDEIREPLAVGSATTARSDRGGAGKHSRTDLTRADQDHIARTWSSNPLGKLPGSVWEIATQPLTVPAELGVDHFAAFPMEWPRRIILGWSPSGICIACGEGRRLIATPTGETGRASGGGGTYRAMRAAGEKDTNLATAPLRVREITGYACACPEPTADTTPAVVLDPFGGTGTTALMASVLGRHGISVDMSADYCRLAAWRTGDPKQIERAQRPPKPRKPRENPSQPQTAADWLAHFGLR